MKTVKPIAAVLLILVAVLIAPPDGAFSRGSSRPAASRPQLQMQHLPRPERFQTRGALADEDRAAGDESFSMSSVLRGSQSSAAEAPTGFDNLTNGFSEQGPPYETLNEDTVVALRSFNDNRFIFEEVETAADGLGPTYNAQSCRECHQNVVTGGASQIAEFRSGRTDNGKFFGSLGGSLIQSRATHPEIVERVGLRGHSPHVPDLDQHARRRLRRGDRKRDAAGDSRQPAGRIRGTAVHGARAGRRRHRAHRPVRLEDQHASLESFAADAYLNEMGITSPLLPEENTSSGRDVRLWQRLRPGRGPEDDGDRCRGLRRLHARDQGSLTRPHHGGVTAGEQVFNQIGCSGCHIASIMTAPSRNGRSTVVR